MRRQSYIIACWLITLLYINWGCKKDSPAPITNPQFPPTPITNTPPTVHVGHDLMIELPNTSVTLTGTARDAEGNIKRYSWKQIHGRVQGNIEKPDSLTTKVSNLQTGLYEFELTVTDTKGLFNADTLTVSVQDLSLPGQGEVSFSFSQWYCPMGCSLNIDCFSCHIPPNKPFKVYLREGNTTQWMEVPHESKWTQATKYVYSVYKDHFSIYNNDDPLSVPDVKIIY